MVRRKPTRSVAVVSAWLLLGAAALGCSSDVSELAGPQRAGERGVTRLAKVAPALVSKIERGEAPEALVVLTDPVGATAPADEDDDDGELQPTEEAASDDAPVDARLAARFRLDTTEARASSRAPTASALALSLSRAGASEARAYRHFPIMKARVDSMRALEMLDADDRVVRVVEDERFEHFLTESLTLVRQPVAEADGKRGGGTSVAVLDTGVDYTHGAFGTCAQPGAAGCKVTYAADTAPSDGVRDDDGHGTNVAAIVLGVAPSTKIIALDVFDGGYAYASAILAAIDWVIENRAARRIVAMNMSFGGGLFTSPCSTSVLALAIAAAKDAGVLSAVASGNSGSSTSISHPACAPAAISVGAVYDTSFGGVGYSSCTDATTRADAVTCFSNSASFLSMLAPGALITAGGHTYAGTSQAAPHVAGAIAVVAATYPTSTPSQIVSRLKGSGRFVTDPRNGVKTPRLDVAASACSAVVLPSSRTVPAAGGTYQHSISTGPTCAWTAWSAASWLTVSPGSTGAGTVSIVVTPNSGAARTGTVSIGGRKIAITQSRGG